MIPERIEATQNGALATATRLLAEGKPAIFQFAGPPYPAKLLSAIDMLCQEYGERLELRFYGGAFDFSVLDAVPNVTNLATDCLDEASNVAALARLRRLRVLSFGVFECSETKLLELLDACSIRELSLGENRQRNFDLRPLRAFTQLRSLFIGGHTKGIESISGLPSLERLRLSMIPRRQELGFVSKIPQLRHMALILGGRDGASDIVSSTLQELEIIRVRGLAQFPPLENLPSLRTLQIEDQLRITSVDITDAHSSLSRLLILNCKGLRRIDGLSNLTGLEHLRICRTALDLDMLLSSPLPEALRIFAFYTGSERKNADARARLDDLGYIEG